MHGDVVLVATYYTCVLVRTVSLLVVLCLADETPHCSVTSSTSRVTLPFLGLHSGSHTQSPKDAGPLDRRPPAARGFEHLCCFAECSMLTSIMGHTPLFSILGCPEQAASTLGCWCEVHLVIVVS